MPNSTMRTRSVDTIVPKYAVTLKAMVDARKTVWTFRLKRPLVRSCGAAGVGSIGQKPKQSSPRYGLRAGADGQLQKDMFDVRFHCLGRDLESSRDLLVGKALADHCEDIAFPRSERIADAATGLPGDVTRIAGSPSAKAGLPQKVEVRGLLSLAFLFLESKWQVSDRASLNCSSPGSTDRNPGETQFDDLECRDLLHAGRAR